MKKLWRSPPARHPFATTSDWGREFERMRRSFGGGADPIPERHVARAETLLAELLESEAEPILLHGDLHHENVLDASATGRDPWLAIDPKGMVGEAAYEAGALPRNPMGLLDRPRADLILERRVHLLSERIGFEPERVLGWGFSQAVLAAYWGWEDEGRVWEQALTFAELLATIRQALKLLFSTLWFGQEKKFPATRAARSRTAVFCYRTIRSVFVMSHLVGWFDEAFALLLEHVLQG